MNMRDAVTDPDPQETHEWLDALESVVRVEGAERARYLLDTLIADAQRKGARAAFSANTAYLNTIEPLQQEPIPGDQALAARLRALVRWNAMVMVVRANAESSGIGGHIATFSSAATLYDVGFNHFFRASNNQQVGDLVYLQGHSSPDIYARVFLEGRITEDQLKNFRREVAGNGLASYPHPWLMPDFWQFATVSMGLGPLMAIYQARFMRYLDDRGIIKGHDRKVWAFLGDGEVDEPESLGAISLAGLESVFRGAGWNVIKVIWGSYWDPLIERDDQGFLLKRMEE